MQFLNRLVVALSHEGIQVGELSQVEKKKRSLSLLIVLGGLTFASLLLGYQAFSNYVLSEKSLKQAQLTFQEHGKTSSPEECVQHAIKWLPECKGLFSLCEQIVPELMTTCLKQQDRKQSCLELSADFRSTRYGAKDCAVLGVTKRYKKSCGLAFRQIDNYCYETGKKGL